MKKILFFFASLMLLSGYVVNAANTETSSTAKTQTGTEVVTLHLNFTADAQTVRFSCPEWNNYGIQTITVYIHNVDAHYWSGNVVDYNITANVLLAGNPESEVAPLIVKPESYVAIDEIDVVSSGDYDFDFVITGIPAW